MGHLLASLIVGLAVPQESSDLPLRSELIELHQAHYERVEQELLEADVDHLDADRRERRARAIAALRDYRLRGEFGVNRDFPGARVPNFVDHAGRRCAVAELLHVFGEDELVTRVAREDNHVWVPELQGDTELENWLDRVGLSFEEAVRIQAPMVAVGGGGGGFPGPPASAPISPGLLEPPVPAGPSSGGPGPDSGGSASRPSSPSAPRSGGSATTGVTASATSQPGVDVTSSWWVWWELNKLDFLRPPRFLPYSGPLTGQGVEFPGAELEALRARTARIVLEELESPHAAIRSTAAVTLGRVAASKAVGNLLPLLEDASAQVRRSALLALGATGDSNAGELLLQVAKTGHAGTSSQGALTAHARAYAIIGLGLARKAGLDESFDARVTALREAEHGEEREEVDLALLLYQRLTPTESLDEFAGLLAVDDGAPTRVRTRATEVLFRRDDVETLGILADLLGGREVELRRSAALALGEYQSDLALPVLISALELEKEPLTRGFLVVSIGKRGGETAREFLEDYLRNGPKTMRAWTALGLGFVARQGSDEARTAIREAYGSERNAEARGAYLLAMGIGGDVGAYGLLAGELGESHNAWTRMHAGLGLALTGAPGAGDAIRQRLAVETHPLTRLALVQGLGLLGDTSDVEAIARELTAQRSAEYHAVAAVAIGLNGKRPALDQALALIEGDEQPFGTRAAAIDAAGLMLSRSPGLTLAKLSRQSNFAAIPDWLLEAFRYSL